MGNVKDTRLENGIGHIPYMLDMFCLVRFTKGSEETEIEA